MRTDCSGDLFGFEAVEGRRVGAAFDGRTMASDAGALLLGRADRRLGLLKRLAGCFVDGRSSGAVEHTIERLVVQRVLGIALGYEDVNDHDELRHDPALAATLGRLAARRSRCAALAGKSTLNRLEHAPSGRAERYHRIGHVPEAIEALLVDVFLEAHAEAPEEIVLDLGATDDLIHGNQEGRFFHATRAFREPRIMAKANHTPPVTLLPAARRSVLPRGAHGARGAQDLAGSAVPPATRERCDAALTVPERAARRQMGRDGQS